MEMACRAKPNGLPAEFDASKDPQRMKYAYWKWAVFYRSIKTRGVAECFYSDKTRAASFLNGFKNIPQKACLLGFQTKVRIVRGKY